MSAQFDDGKDDGALRTIGEVSKALGIKTHVLRYWEQQFPMLEPLKRSGNRRYYRLDDIQLIETINRLVNNEGYTLKGAQQVIEGGSAGPAEPTSPIPEIPMGSEAAAPIAGEFPTAPDGGVDAFFGRESYAEPELGASEDANAAVPVLDGGADEEITNDIDAASVSRAEILEKLSSIRARLAEALAA